MNRRDYLSAVLSAGTALLAGCSGDGDGTGDGSPATDTVTTGVDRTTGESAPETAVPTTPEYPTTQRATTRSGTRTEPPTQTAAPETPSRTATATRSPTEAPTATQTPTATPTPTATQTPAPTTTERTSSPAATVTVGPAGGLSFDPETVTVAVGGTVRWEWDSSGHNVAPTSTPSGSSWSGTPGGRDVTYTTGYTYEHAFEVAGEFDYECAPHASFGMVGTVVVE